MTADTVIDGAQMVSGWNRYMYVSGMPIVAKDANGNELTFFGNIVYQDGKELGEITATATAYKDRDNYSIGNGFKLSVNVNGEEKDSSGVSISAHQEIVGVDVSLVISNKVPNEFSIRADNKMLRFDDTTGGLIEPPIDYFVHGYGSIFYSEGELIVSIPGQVNSANNRLEIVPTDFSTISAHQVIDAGTAVYQTHLAGSEQNFLYFWKDGSAWAALRSMPMERKAGVGP